MTRRSLVRGLLAACALWLAFSPAAGAASFQVSPTRFEFSLERRFTDFFNLTNNSSDPLRLRISTGFVEIDAAGKLVERKNSPFDIAPWIVLNPRRVTLQPGEKRIVRFTVRPPEGLKEGEYRTVVFFEEQPSRPERGRQEGTGIQVHLLTRVGVTLYGRVGKSAPALTLDKPTAELGAAALTVHIAVRNTGSAHATVDVSVRLLDASGAEAASAKERITVQREQVRPFDVQLPRPAAGTYRVQVTAQAKDLPELESEVPLTVPTSSK